MGIYIYRIMAKSRKMVTGETVKQLKFHYKPTFSYYEDVPTPGEAHIDECFATYDYEVGAPVYKMKAGSNFWYDSDEERREIYGYMLPAGSGGYRTKRFEVVRDLTPEQVEALDIISHHSIRTYWAAGGLTFEVDNSTDRSQVKFEITDKANPQFRHTRSYIPGSLTSFRGQVDRVAEILVEFRLKMQEMKPDAA